MRRNILITGASSGLGEEMARQFAAKGYNLALTARREDRLKALQDELLAAHPKATVLVHRLDVNDHAQVFEVFRAVDAEIGGLDRIIVNAGIGKGAPLGTGRFDANLETAQTNFVAVLAQAEAAMEVFRAQDAGAGERQTQQQADGLHAFDSIMDLIPGHPKSPCPHQRERASPIAADPAGPEILVTSEDPT